MLFENFAEKIFNLTTDGDLARMWMIPPLGIQYSEYIVCDVELMLVIYCMRCVRSAPLEAIAINYKGCVCVSRYWLEGYIVMLYVFV